MRFDEVGHAGTTVETVEVLYDGRAVHEHVLSTIADGEMYLLNRHAQIVDDSRIELKVTLRARGGHDPGMEIAIKPAL